MKKYFVDVKNIKNVIDFSFVKDEPYRLLRIFLTHEHDVFYIFFNGKLKAVSSIGDIYRWFKNGMNEFAFNTNFSYISEVNYQEAEKVFDRIRTIYEVPVVKQSKMIGVIRKGEKHSEEEWKNIHATLEWIEECFWRKRRILFFSDEIKRWKRKRDGVELYLYVNHNDIKKYLSESQKKEYEYKMERVLEGNFNKEKYAAEHGFPMEVFHLQVIQSKGIYSIEDYHGKDINIENNYRVTPNVKENTHKIFFLGPCTIFGSYVRDTETIEYYIQEEINKNNLPYQVVNCGLFHEQGLFTEKMKKGDKVIISCFTWWNSEWAELVEELLPEHYKGDLTSCIYRKDPINSWLEGPAHCNGVVNKKMAEHIWADLCKDSKWLTESDAIEQVERSALQDYYIPYEIHRYFDEYMVKNYLIIEGGKKGAIIMNCNPFTLGHRYLIERAAKIVDLLYIFVVEEDKSYYSFEERLEMVKRGTFDLDNIKVLPSGKYILSKDTFAQYFDKESITEVEDMSWDIRIFGEVVAKKLGITYRFVGEEPKDIVTREYNETMKRILSEYGINVIEIPRICTPDSDVISATTVRKLIKVKDWTGLEKYCPKSTIEYLKGRINK